MTWILKKNVQYVEFRKGPLLFILYVYDICNVSEWMNIILFADDTNICFTGESLNKMQHMLGLELGKLSCWFKVNKLSVNQDKTKIMLFWKKTEYQFKLSVDGFDIERVPCIKLLGVISW